MSTATRYQGGFKKESSYGTQATVDAFFLVVSDTIKPQMATLESKSLRPGYAPHKSTFVKYSQGAQGQLKFEVSSKQFSRIFNQCLGAVTTSGPVSNYYTHTYTMGELDSFTWQGNRPTFPTDGDQPYTYAGGKIPKWKLSNSVDNLLELLLDCDFRSWTDGSQLETASYPSADNLFSFLGASVLIDGTSTSVGCSDISFEVDNQLKLDRRYLDGSGLKSEQVGNGNYRAGTWTAMCDFDDTTQVDRVAALTADDGANAEIIAEWGVAGIDDKLRVTVASARFDEGFPEVSGPESLMTPLKGGINYDGTNSPVKVEYITRTSQPT